MDFLCPITAPAATTPVPARCCFKFLDRYFPGPALNEPTLATAADDAAQVAGSYEVSRGFRTNVLAVLTLLGEAKIVVDKKDNTIFVDDAFKNANGVPKHFCAK